MNVAQRISVDIEKEAASEKLAELARAALTVVDEFGGPSRMTSNESVDSLRHVLRKLGCLS